MRLFKTGASKHRCGTCSGVYVVYMFLVNTFAMMWGKWLPKTGYGPWPIDGGRVHKDGNRILGDGKTWNGLIGGSLTSGLLCYLMTMIPENWIFLISGRLRRSPDVFLAVFGAQLRKSK